MGAKRMDLTGIKRQLNPKKKADKGWYLALLDEAEQRRYEEEHLSAVLAMLKIRYIARYRKKIFEAKEEIARLKGGDRYTAEDYRAVQEQLAAIAEAEKRLNEYRCFFSEPYFARMDVVDDKEGYNSYYIGKKGDMQLEIVDWRAPLAVRYYQKSRVRFTIHEYDYRTVLRRALAVKSGKLVDFKNEYLSVKDVLTPEEIAGRDEEILFDPYLRSIIRSRKDDAHVRDIIETIQEKQFAIVTLPEKESFVLQGCAGSGKTMILLHRLSYLMYNNENLRPRDVLVITPSDSFNAFIDELSRALELESVRTVTLNNYYFRALENEGIDLKSKLTGEKEGEDYLAYLYSPAFQKETEEDIARLYADVRGLLDSRECREVAEKTLGDCRRRSERYVRVKNASTRVRRAVLGEMKDDKAGGFYFTKPFRGIMSAFAQAEDFLTRTLAEEQTTADRFFRYFAEFYRCAQTVCAGAEKAFAQAQADLDSLRLTVEREIADLGRYRVRRGAEEILTYAERIARREELLSEIGKIRSAVGKMGEGLELFEGFFAVIRSSSDCSSLGKCRDGVDISRWIYRNTVKKYKARYGMKGVYPSDGYALSYALTAAGRKLTPRYGLVFVDEGQDVSAGEYALLKRIHDGAAFNVFGDLKQNVTPWRGVKDWGCLSCNEYTLVQNYRNTNEIVEFVSGALDAEMEPIGLHGEKVVTLRPRGVGAFFRGKQGTKAVIAKEEYLPLFKKRGYALLSATERLSRTKINVMTPFESKGLEFSAVAVYDRGMTDHEKYIAYTRALRELAVVREEP